MKLTKRIIALMIVLCTIGAMMIPGVSAADDDLNIVFNTDFTAAGLASNNWLDATNVAKLNYPNTANWTTDVAGNVYNMRVRSASLHLGLQSQFTEAINTYSAIRFTAPGTGDYTMTLTAAEASQSEQKIGLLRTYIIPAPAEPYAKYSEFKTAMDTYMNTEPAALVSYSPDAIRSGAVEGTGATAALTAGSEYYLVFCMFNDNLDSLTLNNNKYNTYAQIASISLNKKVVVQPEPEEPGTEVKTDNLTVNFKTNLEAVGQTGSGSFKAWYDTYKSAYDNGTISWLPYGVSKNALVCKNNISTAANGGQFSFNSGKTNAWLELTSQDAGVAFATMKFKAPGTGNYKLSISYSKRSSGSANPAEGGAYILEIPEGGYVADTLPVATSDLAKAKVTATVGTAGTYTSEGVVALEYGKEYIIVFYSNNDAASCIMYYTGFALTYQAAAATIGSVSYDSLQAALIAAVDGNTIVLGRDVEASEVNVPEGVTLDLNGKTLTAPAVVGAVCDSADGNGLVATAKESIITAAAGQIALWDNNEQASGYRVFNYKFANYGVSEDEDDTTGVGDSINFFAYEKDYLDTSDSKLRDVSSAIKASYDAKDINWRIEMGSYAYSLRIPGDIEGNNGVGPSSFSSGTKTLRYDVTVNNWLAIRLRTPGEGKIATTLKTDSSNTALYDAYIVKASELAAYAEHSAALAENLCQAGGTTAVFTEYKAAIEAAIANKEVVFSVDEAGVTKSFSGAFEYEADTEYIMVLKATQAGSMRLSDLSFYRAEKKGMTQSFWSTLKFDNAKAYTLINTKESGLKFGYSVTWDGQTQSGKVFEYDDKVIAAWAKDQGNDTANTYGLYIRVSGFEGLTENGVLSAKPYIEAAGNTVYTEGAMTYNYEA